MRRDRRWLHMLCHDWLSPLAGHTVCLRKRPKGVLLLPQYVRCVHKAHKIHKLRYTSRGTEVEVHKVHKIHKVHKHNGQIAEGIKRYLTVCVCGGGGG